MVWFGSGLGSTLSALGLTVLGFWFRRASFMRNLKPGDRFLDRYDFPLRRFDHTLATWPLIASALFLTGKIIYRNTVFYLGGSSEVGWLHGLALILASASCVALAIYLRKNLLASQVLVHFAVGVLAIASLQLFALGSQDISPAWRWIAFLGAAVAMFLVFRFGLMS